MEEEEEGKKKEEEEEEEEEGKKKKKKEEEEEEEEGNAFEKLVSVCSKYALTGHFNAVNELNNLVPASVPRSEELDYLAH